MAVAAGVLFLAPALVAAPAPPAPDVLLPAGHLLQGRLVEGEMVLEAVPVDASTRDHWPGGTAECENDVLSTSSTLSWHMASTRAPASPTPLRASEGECVPERHEGPITFFQFHTAGDHFGWVSVQDAAGFFKVGCAPAGVFLGAGASHQWALLVPLDAGDTWCFVESRGAKPGEFTDWEAFVVNEHYRHGSTYASFN